MKKKPRRPVPPDRSPKPAEVLAFRLKHGLTPAAAAQLAYSSERTWQNWESGVTKMHPAIWGWVQHVQGTISDLGL